MTEIEIFLGICTLVLGVLTYWLQKEKGALEDNLHSSQTLLQQKESRLEQLREYGRKTRLIDYQYFDAVMLGPRGSGKTSISQLWTSPWTQISEIQSSSTWRQFEANLHEFEPETRQDHLFEVERTRMPILRMRVHDYPGENFYRLKAIKDLSHLGRKVVLLFIFQVEFNRGQVQYDRENAAYFSRAFVEEIEQHLPRLSTVVAKVFIVFNKVDVLPEEWSDEEALCCLKEANADAIHEIGRVFSGMLDYRLISARTNKGIVGLLGEIGRMGVSEQNMNQYNSAITILEREFELQGVYP